MNLRTGVARFRERLVRLARGHKNLVPAVGAAAGVVGAYAAIALLRRQAGAGTPAPIATAPGGNTDLGGGGSGPLFTDSPIFGGAWPLSQASSPSPGNPGATPGALAGPAAASPTLSPTLQAGQAQGRVAPVSLYQASTAQRATVPGTTTPAGSAAVLSPIVTPSTPATAVRSGQLYEGGPTLTATRAILASSGQVVQVPSGLANILGVASPQYVGVAPQKPAVKLPVQTPRTPTAATRSGRIYEGTAAPRPPAPVQKPRTVPAPTPAPSPRPTNTTRL